jgi:hypothetical protein
MGQRLVAAVAVAVALVAACNPNSTPSQAAVLELLGGPKSATDYSREITVRQVTLATGEVRSWSLGVDFGAKPLPLAPASSQPPAAYLLGYYGRADLGIYTFPGSGPQHISGALQAGNLGQMINGLGSEIALAPNGVLFGNDRNDVVQLTLDGTVVHRWPIPIPVPGTYSGPSAHGEPNGHSIRGVGVVLDSAGDPFAITTNGLNGVLVDLTRGKRADLPGLGFIKEFQIRADGQAFAIVTSFAPLPPTTTPTFCGPASNYCFYSSMDSVIELDTRTMQVTGRYSVPAPPSAAYSRLFLSSRLFLGRSTVDVIQQQETYSNLLTLSERSGTFVEHQIPIDATFTLNADGAGNLYGLSHPYPGVLPASGARNPGFQDRLMFYDRTTGKTSDASRPLRPPPDQEVLGLLFRN